MYSIRRTFYVFVAISLLFGLLSEESAYAQSKTRRAVILFKEAKLHYNLGQYDLAVDKFSAAIRVAPSLPGPYRNLGLTYRAMDKCALALPNFRKYLQLQPTGKYAKRVRSEVAYCSNKVGQNPNATFAVGAAQLVLQGAAAGAQIHIDGTLRGSTPTSALPLQPGKHTVSLFLSGYLPWTQGVSLSKGQTLVLKVALLPDPNFKKHQAQATAARKKGPPGTLRLLGIPRSAQITVDDIVTGLDENEESRASQGEHTVRIIASGLKPWSQKVTIQAGQTTIVTPMLESTDATDSLRKWAWISVGAAATLGIAGAVLGLIENNEYEKIRDNDPSLGTRAELDDLETRRNALGLASNILYGLATAALGTGVLLFVVTPEIEQSEAAGIRAMLSTRLSF